MQVLLTIAISVIISTIINIIILKKCIEMATGIMFAVQQELNKLLGMIIERL
ncbi:hypothetical protein [Jeotgalibaca porci]|uniref:hypothetical protein n=1 Tax=Jeotgalibaca porci TaxID=1868793 RepID=UPI0035A13C40